MESCNPPLSFAHYQDQDCPLTLREGLAELFCANPGLTPFQPGDPGAELFLCHDACHVVFGLGTCVLEEALVDYWTLFGSDIPFKTYLSYGKHLTKVDFGGVARRLGWVVMARETLRSAPYLFQVRSRARSMRKPWPFDGYQQYLDVPLAQIRSEFGIQLIRVPRSSLPFSTVGKRPAPSQHQARA